MSTPTATPKSKKKVEMEKVTPAVPVDLRPIVRQNVLAILGCPQHLNKIVVTNVHGNKYRVTIYCSRQNSSLLVQNYIAHSFFIEANEKGDIMKSDPPIEREYD